MLMNNPDFLLHWQLLVFLLLCIVTGVQLFYYLFFFIRITFYTNPSTNNNNTLPVAIIICARNEKDNLAKNLPASLQQNYPAGYQVTVVNDGSIDDSQQLLQQLQLQFKQLRVMEITQAEKPYPGKKYPLSKGIAAAQQAIILLTDADCQPASPDWLQKMQQQFTPGTDIVLGYGAYHKKPGLLNKLVRWETFHTAIQYLSYALAGIPYMGVGRNLSYRKSIFVAQAGFAAHTNIPGGDDDLFISGAATKTNTRINIDVAAFTLSEPVSSWAQWRKQKTRHYSTSKFYRPLHQFLLAAYAGSHFLFFPFLLISGYYCSWSLTLIAFFIRLIIQALVLYPAMKKLNEKDLFPLFLVFDLWMFFYYLIFAFALIKKPKASWN